MTEDNSVVEEEKIKATYEKLMNLLIEGPKNDKLENIIPKGTKVLKTFIEEDITIQGGYKNVYYNY